MKWYEGTCCGVVERELDVLTLEPAIWTCDSRLLNAASLYDRKLKTEADNDAPLLLKEVLSSANLVEASVMRRWKDRG